MNFNAKLHEVLGLMGFIPPSNQAAGAAVSGWILVDEAESILALIQTGTFGASATVDAKIQQATSAAGAGAKDITGKAITQLVAATGNNQVAGIHVRGDELDVNNGFCYVQLSVTVGVAATETSAMVVAGNLRNMPAALPAAVQQIVA